MTAAYRKKTVREIDLSLLQEPALTPEDWADFENGVRLFNTHDFWHAHEAWEAVWKRRSEESRIFFQGMIQLAAAYHLLVVKKRYGGMIRNFAKAEEKLRLFTPHFMRINVLQLLQSIESARKEITRIDNHHLDAFDNNLIPTIILS